MALIEFEKATVEFAIYNATGRSLKKQLFQMATGGQIGSDGRGRVVVRALENLTFSLRDGDKVGLLGHNGAGKIFQSDNPKSVGKRGRLVVEQLSLIGLAGVCEESKTEDR